MNLYSKVAVEAVNQYTKGNVQNPIEAWQKAVVLFTHSRHSINKNCPRATFLSLCQEGLIKGIPRGKYTKAKENREYVLKAIEILKKEPQLVSRPSELWNIVKGGNHDRQMHVITSLWNAGLIEINNIGNE